MQIINHLTEARRKKLDDLFADQPYLSATMKASLVHEKIVEERRKALRSDEPLSTYEEPIGPTSYKIEQQSVTVIPLKELPAGLAESSSALHFDLYVDLTTDPPTFTASARSLICAPEVMTTREAAGYIRISVGTLRRWAAAGRIPSKRLGQQLRFERNDLIELLGTAHDTSIEGAQDGPVPKRRFRDILKRRHAA